LPFDIIIGSSYLFSAEANGDWLKNWLNNDWFPLAKEGEIAENPNLFGIAKLIFLF
jgi:hypothetical protein